MFGPFFCLLVLVAHAAGVANPGFDSAPSPPIPTFSYVAPASWTGTGAVVTIASSNPSWGSFPAQAGGFYVGLQVQDAAATTDTAAISQNVAFPIGPVAYGFWYAVRSLCTTGGGGAVTLDVTVSGVSVIGGPLTITCVATVWTFVPIQFTSVTSAPVPLVFIVNKGPGATLAYDQTVFIDSIAPIGSVLLNPNFEVAPVPAAGSFEYRLPAEWHVAGPRVVVIGSGNPLWDGQAAQNGDYFTGLQVLDATPTVALTQYLAFLPGQSVEVQFYRSIRSGFCTGGGTLTLTVLVAGSPIYGPQTIACGSGPAWILETASFTATSAAPVALTFRVSNTGFTAGSLDQTVFIDNITLLPCGTVGAVPCE